MISNHLVSLNTDCPYFFKKGNKGRFISYDEYGMVMIAENCKKIGYYMIKRIVKQLKTCYIVELSEEILIDYYEGMPYDMFKGMLKLRGYKIAYELPFTYVHCDGEVTDEFQVVAYNSELNIVIKAETFTLPGDPITFNTIYCYCFGTNCFRLTRPMCFSMGTSEYTVFDIIYSSRPNLLKYVESYANSGAVKGTFELLSARTYADKEMSIESYDHYRTKFYNLIPDELKDWFKYEDR